MKKLTVLAMVAVLMVAGSAFARVVLTPAPNASGAFAAGSPASTQNDDSCDIGVTPAATLLLPFFDVDVVDSQAIGTTTLFTVTNTSPLPEIAHVTVWTDWSFPVLDFNIWLTGYDSKSINLYDVFVKGFVIPPSGTSATSTTISPIGARSDVYTTAAQANPDFAAGAVAGCANQPGALPSTLVSDVRSALTTGSYPTVCGATKVGGTHTDAIGYITIDVANNCSTTLPTTSSYYTGEILFDNVLVGDYQIVSPNPAGVNAAAGAPMVHIRATPEGGPAGSIPTAAVGNIATNLPFTFYDRYTPLAAKTVDRRQPLPATFAARWIQGGTSSFNTNYIIWREGLNSATSCASAAGNSQIPVSDVVRFDQHENPTTAGPGSPCSPAALCGPSGFVLPETSNTPTSVSAFPPLSTSGDVGGWMYLNLSDNTGTTGVYTAQRTGFGAPISALTYAQGGTTAVAGASSTFGRAVSQNWVVVNMQLVPRFSVAFDAAWLGNGCTPPVATGAVISPANERPAGNPVCPTGVACVAPPGTVPFQAQPVNP